MFYKTLRGRRKMYSYRQALAVASKKSLKMTRILQGNMNQTRFARCWDRLCAKWIPSTLLLSKQSYNMGWPLSFPCLHLHLRYITLRQGLKAPNLRKESKLSRFGHIRWNNLHNCYLSPNDSDEVFTTKLVSIGNNRILTLGLWKGELKRPSPAKGK